LMEDPLSVDNDLLLVGDGDLGSNLSSARFGIFGLASLFLIADVNPAFLCLPVEQLLVCKSKFTKLIRS